jgi:hypothetical protein
MVPIVPYNAALAPRISIIDERIDPAISVMFSDVIRQGLLPRKMPG